MVNNSLNSSQRGRRASSDRPHGFYSQESTDDQDDVSLGPSDEDRVNNEEDILDYMKTHQMTQVKQMLFMKQIKPILLE